MLIGPCVLFFIVDADHYLRWSNDTINESVTNFILREEK